MVIRMAGKPAAARTARDGGMRRGEVIDNDHNPARVVRHVGWRVCLKCSDPFWSSDVRRLRMCNGCKTQSSYRKGAGDSP